MSNRFCLSMIAGAVLSCAVVQVHAGGYDVGVATYSFRKWTAFEAIEKTKACGHVAVEYENITDHLIDDVTFCIGFIRSH